MAMYVSKSAVSEWEEDFGMGIDELDVCDSIENLEDIKWVYEVREMDEEGSGSAVFFLELVDGTYVGGQNVMQMLTEIAS